METLKNANNLAGDLDKEPALNQEDIKTVISQGERGVWVDAFYQDLLMEQQEQF